MENNEQNNDENIVEETNTEETTDTEEESTEETPEDVDVNKMKEELSSRKRDIKKLQKENEELKKPKETSDSKESESNEPDYAKIGFLNGEGVKHPDDQKIVFEEAARLKLPLTDVLQMEHIKAKLTTQNDTRVSQDGMPEGSGRKGGPNKGDVDYYLTHPEETPKDLDLHNKVIDAKLKKESDANMFSDKPFIG